jgi:hypothetical protein
MPPCKIYGHIDTAGRHEFCQPFVIPRPDEMQFGTIKQEFLARFEAAHPNEASLKYEECCFWNQDCCPIPDRSAIALFAYEHNDFFLRLLPASQREATTSLGASQEKRGELSYYYAHNQRNQSLISRPSAVASVAPAQPKREPLKVAPTGDRTGIYNSKQSPFGTDISQYETITTYTWEDGGHDGDTVKVLVPLEGVGKLPPGNIRTNFGVRQFELLVDGYNGKNVRFACNKTHAEMKPDECKHIIRANRVNLLLRKAKEKDVWFDLFKKRAIGDDDDP